MKGIKYCLYLLIGLLVITSCSLDIQGEQNGEVYIVTVGLDYQNTLVSDLMGTVDDALEISECFKGIYNSKGIPCYTTYMIQEGSSLPFYSDEYPTKENILNKLKSLPVTKNDLLIFYYSGHGDMEEDRGYLATACSTLDEENPNSLYTRLYADELFSALDSLPCQAVAMIDACYSGQVATGGSFTSVKFLESITKMFSDLDLRGVHVLAACAPSELSYVSSTINMEGLYEAHSAFTISILNALNWEHTQIVGEDVLSCGKLLRINGRNGSSPAAMTSEELFDRVSSSWSDERQTPVQNKPAVKVQIVPKF